jgi:hypothetical protein
VATMLIGYDLNSPSQNYEELFDAIRNLGTWWHCLDSTWLVTTNLTPLEVANRLWSKMDKNDRLLVTRVNRSTTAWAGMTQDCSDWLRNTMQD